MMLSFICLGGFCLLFLLSANKQVPKPMKNKWFLLPFYKISAFLLELRVGKIICGHRKAIGKNSSFLIYDMKRMAVALGIVFIGSGVSLVAALAENADKLKAGHVLQRPSYGEEAREEELLANIEGADQEENISIRLEAQDYTKEQKKEFLKRAVKNMESWILGKNSSIDEIREALILDKSFMDGMIQVEWNADPVGIFDEDGKIVGDIPEKGILVKLYGQLSCGTEKGTYETYVKVFPPLLTESEKLNLLLQKEVDRRIEKSISEQELELPKKIDGKSVIWSKQSQKTGEVLCILGIVAGISFFVGKERELQQMMLKRKNQLVLDYPELLFKLSMLLGAGLTIRSAFSKIALEYKKSNKNQKRYAYEEMVEAYYEMERGVSEASAYENFGKRCRVSGYIKLGVILAQSLKKGSDGLAQLLQNEALMYMEERKQAARKMGEEAGTKILLPMGLMLIIVLAILMVPAMLSF